MFLRTKVKADSITNLTDARYFAAAGVEWLGFSINAAASLDDIQTIIEWVDGVKIILEFGEVLSAADYEAIEKLHPDFIQVNIQCNLDDLHEPIPVIKTINPAQMDMEALTELLEENVEDAAGFVIDLCDYTWEDLQTGNAISPTDLEKIINGYSCLLKLNFSSKNINEVIEKLQPDGICIEGGTEEKVGYKSFEPLDELLEILATEE